MEKQRLMTAKEAREKIIYTKDIDAIFREIKRTALERKFHAEWDYISHEDRNKLEELGFKVSCGYGGIFRISW